MDTVIQQLSYIAAASAGVAALFSQVVNILKRLRLVKDGQAGKVVAFLNFAFLAIVWCVTFFGFDVDLNALNKYAETAGKAIPYLLPVLMPFMQWVAAKVHDVLAGLGVPLLGFSYTRERTNARVG